MIKHYDFKDGIDFNDFYYCYSPQAKCAGLFEREEDCIKSRWNDEIGKFEYTTIMMKGTLKVGSKITTECMWEKRGAPLIVITDQLSERNGQPSYDEHFEAVVFEEGCNVWHLTMPTDPNWPKPVVAKKVHFESLPTPNFTRVKLEVTFLDGGMDITMNGHNFKVALPTMPKEFSFGITGCEGINRFYNLTVEK